MPPYPDGCPEESAVRFEYIQPISGSSLNPCQTVLTPHRPVGLSEEARALLLVHLTQYVGVPLRRQKTAGAEEAADAAAKILDDIGVYRQLLLEQLGG
jgi:hypothetical protein